LERVLPRGYRVGAACCSPFEAKAESTFETARLEGLDVGEFLGGTDDLA
jgi:hypothetical protein